jgi:hypothetical protein
VRRFCSATVRAAATRGTAAAKATVDDEPSEPPAVLFPSCHCHWCSCSTIAAAAAAAADDSYTTTEAVDDSAARSSAGACSLLEDDGAMSTDGGEASGGDDDVDDDDDIANGVEAGFGFADADAAARKEPRLPLYFFFGLG